MLCVRQHRVWVILLQKLGKLAQENVTPLYNVKTGEQSMPVNYIRSYLLMMVSALVSVASLLEVPRPTHGSKVEDMSCLVFSFFPTSS